jgi:hypothetical protein
VVYPITDEAGARDDTEIAIFTVDEIEKSGLVQLLQARKIQLRPQAALDGRVDQLVEICQMPLKQFSRYADGDMGSERGGNTAIHHDLSSLLAAAEAEIFCRACCVVDAARR